MSILFEAPAVGRQRHRPVSFHSLRRRWRLAQLRRQGRRLLFIAGCARSGTSLLRQLMAAFDDTAAFPRERSFWHLLEMSDRPESTLVVKRTSECHRELHRLPAEVDLIYCVRHPYDCLTSSHPQTIHLRPFHVTRERWIAEYRAMDRLRLAQRRRSVTVVRYEDLVTRPDDVQGALVDAIGLRPHGTFSRNRLGIEIRPSSLEKWRHRPELRAHLAGIDDDWLAEIGRFCGEFGYGPPPSLRDPAGVGEPW